MRLKRWIFPSEYFHLRPKGSKKIIVPSDNQLMLGKKGMGIQMNPESFAQKSFFLTHPNGQSLTML